jgi:pantoate kinase
VTPGDPFINAVQEPNVEVVFKSVAKLTEDGVIDTDGVERKVDAVVCATGRFLAKRPIIEDILTKARVQCRPHSTI